MLHPPGFYYVKKPKRFVIFSSDKGSERNLSCFFDIKNPRRMEHLQSEEPFSSDPYFREIFLVPYVYFIPLWRALFSTNKIGTSLVFGVYGRGFPSYLRSLATWRFITLTFCFFFCFLLLTFCLMPKLYILG